MRTLNQLARKWCTAVVAGSAAAAYGSTTAPFVVGNPPNQTANVGVPTSLSGIVKGSLPITYQWKKDGVDVPGATSTMFFKVGN